MPMPPILPTLDWKHIIESGQEFSAWIEAAENPDHREKMLAAVERQRLEPTVVGALAKLPRPVTVVAIAEDWCGDVVRHVPVLERMRREATNLQVRYIRREQHPDAFARFLTNGGEAIPKFVFLSDALVETGTWGPMPEQCREVIARGKACGDGKTAREIVSAMYGADEGRQIVANELLHRITIACAERP